MKTPNEAVVESIGSMLTLHSKPNRNCDQTIYHNELMIDWNGPSVALADGLIRKAIDMHFSDRKKWNFKATNSKFIVSEVIDRQLKVAPKLSFLM